MQVKTGNSALRVDVVYGDVGEIPSIGVDLESPGYGDPDEVALCSCMQLTLDFAISLRNALTAAIEAAERLADTESA